MSSHKNLGGVNISAVVVLAYFVFLMGGLFFFSKTQPTLCFSVFGTLLVLISILFVFNSKGVIRRFVVGVLFGFAGICMIIFPLLLLYAPSFKDVDGQRLGITIVILFIIAIGFSALIFIISNLIHKKICCTMPVDADVTNRIFRRAGQGVAGGTQSYLSSYRYQYTFMYRGKKYQVEDEWASNMDKLHVGDKIKLYIKPDEPTVFYRKCPHRNIAGVTMGLVWLAIGILCLAVYVF